jgi:hypothetical protein
MRVRAADAPARVFHALLHPANRLGPHWHDRAPVDSIAHYRANRRLS